MKTSIKFIILIIAAAVALFLLIQLVPYGRNHTNQPILGEPAWDSPQTRELMQRACFDCHSNESTWPWYSNIAPISWLVQNDVEEGRSRLNFSEWGRGEAETDDMYEVVREEEMPPAIYLLTHPKARLNNQDFQSLLSGIQATFGGQAGD